MWVQLTLGPATAADPRLPERPLFRYNLIRRAASSLARQEATLLAWGFEPDALRLVADGPPDGIRRACKGLKCGTLTVLQRMERPTALKVTRQPTPDLETAVVWAHRAPLEGHEADGPLASPWSSHRDLLCFRDAAFFDGSALRRAVCARRVHARCGGDPLPAGWPPPSGREDLGLLLRLAAAVLGLLPGDRQTFRLFVHLARRRGWSTDAVACALVLTPRRVRQLAAKPEPYLPLALTALADPRLLVVP